MSTEIERKFFVEVMPDLTGITPVHYERYFLFRNDTKEERIAKIGNIYVHEVKKRLSSLQRTRIKKKITAERFNSLKEHASEAIIRDRYSLSSNPAIVIHIYHGRFQGLVRAEVEFESEQQAALFKPPSWLGKEMTGLPIANDAQLLDLSDEEFQKYVT